MVETVVSRMIPLIIDYLRVYEAERAVRGRKLSRNVSDSEELDVAIAAKYKEECGTEHPVRFHRSESVVSALAPCSLSTL
jgi:sorting nexin-25